MNNGNAEFRYTPRAPYKQPSCSTPTINQASANTNSSQYASFQPYKPQSLNSIVRVPGKQRFVPPPSSAFRASESRSNGQSPPSIPAHPFATNPAQSSTTYTQQRFSNAYFQTQEQTVTKFQNTTLIKSSSEEELVDDSGVRKTKNVKIGAVSFLSRLSNQAELSKENKMPFSQSPPLNRVQSVQSTSSGNTSSLAGNNWTASPTKFLAGMKRPVEEVQDLTVQSNEHIHQETNAHLKDDEVEGASDEDYDYVEAQDEDTHNNSEFQDVEYESNEEYEDEDEVFEEEEMQEDENDDYHEDDNAVGGGEIENNSQANEYHSQSDVGHPQMEVEQTGFEHDNQEKKDDLGKNEEPHEIEGKEQSEAQNDEHAAFLQEHYMAMENGAAFINMENLDEKVEESCGKIIEKIHELKNLCVRWNHVGDDAREQMRNVKKELSKREEMMDMYKTQIKSDFGGIIKRHRMGQNNN
ncbi:hypothetical protein HK098_000173 [Nowakowskiella sp. JEL0407]|nr:hypothetical protein HK098_000173 [Nowakowskiella sp. JEL0407]